MPRIRDLRCAGVSTLFLWSSHYFKVLTHRLIIHSRETQEEVVHHHRQELQEEVERGYRDEAACRREREQR
jgi:hypothetical protein